MVEHSLAYREVGGSIPFAPFFIIVGYMLKDFRCLKYINLVNYFELPRNMNNDFFRISLNLSPGFVFLGNKLNGLLRDCSQNHVYLLSVGYVGM